MKFVTAVFFLALGGALFFLLRTPEKEAMDNEKENSEEIVADRSISNKSFYPPLKTDAPKKMGKNGKSDLGGANKEKEIQMELREAVNNELFGGIVNGPNATGSLVIFENQIQSLSVNITPFGKAPINFQLEGIPLEAAGSFVYEGDEEMVSGILTPSGDKNYILRFATGPLVGSTLMFEVISSVEDKIGSEEAQMAQANSVSNQIETQEMNQAPEDSFSEMNQDYSQVEEMPVNEAEVNQEMEVVDYSPETTAVDMQESVEGSGINF